MKTPDSQSEYLNIEEFCQLVPLSESTVRRRIRAGDIPSWQPGGTGTRILIPVSCLESFEKLPAAKPALEQASQPSPKPIAGPRPRWMQSETDMKI